MTSAVERTTPALISRNLCKTFPAHQGDVRQALDSVSFEVQYGELTALVGPDGAGKTTFIRLAAGLMSADSGELKVLGIDVAASRARARTGREPTMADAFIAIVEESRGNESESASEVAARANA
jgi:ABC-type multidrug transport system ATPase subunit